MKKIIIIFMFLFLVGCNKEVSVNSNAKIILNIDTEVMPEITPSTGEGSFDITEMQYTLKVDNINPVKISLASEGYETVIVDITSEELVSKVITKNVSFGTPISAKVSIKIRTDLDMSVVKAEGYDFTQKDNEFSATLPSRDEEFTVKISATEEYQTYSFKITPDDLRTGLYENEVLLVKKDKAIIKFNNSLNQKNFSTQLFNIKTNFSYEPIVIKGNIYFVVDKNEELYYKDVNGVFIYYLKAVDNIDIDLFKQSNEALPIYKTYRVNRLIDSQIERNMYYELNDQLHSINVTSRNEIRIPLGSKLLFVEYNQGFYMLRYHQGFNQNEDTVSLEYSDFNIKRPFKYKLRLYDVVNKHYIEDLIINSKSLAPNSDIFYEDLNLLSLSCQEYDLSLLKPLTDAVRQGNEWVVDSGVMPMYKGVILRFVDKNNQPVYINDINVIHQSISEDKVIINNAVFPISNFQINYVTVNQTVTNELLVFVEGRWYYTKNALFAYSFESFEVDGNNYLNCIKPIELMYDKFDLVVGLEGINRFGGVKITSSSGHEVQSIDNYSMLIVKRVRLDDIIRLTVSQDMMKYSVNIKCTSDIMEQGLYYYSLYKKEKLEVNQINITLSDDNILYHESFNLNYSTGYMTIRADESKRACTIYYIGNPSQVILNYKRVLNDIENTKIIHITNGNQTYHID